MSAGYVRVFNFNRGMHPDGQPEPNETVIAADRTHPILGNHGAVVRDRQSLTQRRDAIDGFARRLANDLQTGGPLSVEIDALAARVQQGEHIALGCWCKPRDCHVDLIAREVMLRAAPIHDSDLAPGVDPLSGLDPSPPGGPPFQADSG